MTRQEFETALDAGKLEVDVGDGRWWKARRNDTTQTWKRNPKKFRTPIKFGFRGTGAIDEWNINVEGLRVVD